MIVCLQGSAFHYLKGKKVFSGVLAQWERLVFPKSWLRADCIFVKKDQQLPGLLELLLAIVVQRRMQLQELACKAHLGAPFTEVSRFRAVSMLQAELVRGSGRANAAKPR